MTRNVARHRAINHTSNNQLRVRHGKLSCTRTEALSRVRASKQNTSNCEGRWHTEQQVDLCKLRAPYSGLYLPWRFTRLCILPPHFLVDLIPILCGKSVVATIDRISWLPATYSLTICLVQLAFSDPKMQGSNGGVKRRDYTVSRMKSVLSCARWQVMSLLLHRDTLIRHNMVLV